MAPKNFLRLAVLVVFLAATADAIRPFPIFLPLAQNLIERLQRDGPAWLNVEGRGGGEAFDNAPYGRYLESTTDDTFWVPSSNNSYVPSENVKNGHMLSGQKLALNASYAQAVITLPVVFLALGLVAGLFAVLGLLCRCCFKCCKCLPKEKGETMEERVHAIKTQKKGWSIVFFILVLFTIIADFICYYGYDYIDKGVNKFYDSLTLLLNIIVTIASATTAMSGYASDLQLKIAGAKTACCGSVVDTVAKAACVTPFANIENNLLPTLTSATSAIANAVSPFKTSMSQFIDLTKQYLFDYRKMFIFIIFAIALVAVILLVVSHLCQSRKAMKFSVFVSFIFYFLMVILSCPFMIFTSLFSDVCYPNPAQNLARQVTGSTRDMIVFYSTCRGTDTLRQDFLKAATAFGTMNVIVGNLANSCPNTDPDKNLYYAANDLTGIGAELSKIANAVSCPSLKEVLTTFLNDSLCGGIQSGLYSIWISQLITSFFLFFLIIAGTVLYQYYDGAGHKVLASDEEVAGVVVHGTGVGHGHGHGDDHVEKATAYVETAVLDDEFGGKGSGEGDGDVELHQRQDKDEES